jgi:hypothetical protein
MTRPLVATDGRRHRRRWLLALPLVALLVLVVADRILVGVVERHLSGRLTCVAAMTGGHAVRIHGFPFLTQAVTGHFPAVTMTADGLGGANRLTDIEVTFHDLRLPPLSGLAAVPSPGSLRVGSIVVAATIPLADAGPFAQLAERPNWPGQVQGFPTGLSLTVPGLPSPVQLEAMRPVAGGIRVTVAVSGGSANAVLGAARCQP